MPELGVLREQIYEIVLRAILNGEFKPGSSRPCCPE
jgi:DNA-binding GntR family transcriptional regulator